MTKEQLSKVEIPGEVVDVKDPQKKGRIKVKVTAVYDKLDTSSIPWASPIKEPHGKSFKTPDVGQIVNVRFEDGDHYRPIYTYAEHHNINLQKKLDSLSDEDYINFTALYFDDNLQIYKDSEKFVMDYNYNQIVIDKGSINLSLKDNGSKVYIGDESASQPGMLGDNWLNWFDSFMQVMLVPFFGNSGAAVLPTPNMINILNQYSALRNNFISDHIFLVDNNGVNNNDDRISIGQKGDKWKSTVKENELTIEYFTPAKPSEISSDLIGDPSYVAPSTVEGITLPQENNYPEDFIIEGDNDPLINNILNKMVEKNYIIHTEPYRLNLIGIRKWKHGDSHSNKFEDAMHIIYKTEQNGKWKHKKFRISTVPGLATKGELKGGYLGNPPQDVSLEGKVFPTGVSVLALGQYENAWKVGNHKRSGSEPHRALVARKNLPVLRQKGKSTKVFNFKVKVTNDGGGINIHATAGSKKKYRDKGYLDASRKLSNWSRGCQTFPKWKDYLIFQKLIFKQDEKGYNNFTYTLISILDFKDKNGLL